MAKCSIIGLFKHQPSSLLEVSRWFFDHTNLLFTQRKEGSLERMWKLTLWRMGHGTDKRPHANQVLVCRPFFVLQEPMDPTSSQIMSRSASRFQGALLVWERI